MKTLPPTALSVNEGTSVIKEEYSGSNGLKVIGFTIVNGGGHTWPGGSRYMPEFMVGSVTRNLNACREIWNFFKGNRPAAFN
ncbi:MAG: phospholipase [Mucilaginibacter sp.]|nr:phospholipase [Mucilaginibacter sp.]